jgi:hypothetical protein
MLVTFPRMAKTGSQARIARRAVEAVVLGVVAYGVLRNFATSNLRISVDHQHADVFMRNAFDSMPPPEAINEKHCNVLIRNDEVNYHYEVLESVLALYPLPQLPSCNRSQIKFTIAITGGDERILRQERSASWYEYANQSMARHEYDTFEGQSRVLEKVIVITRNSSRLDTLGFDYQIGASCTCDNEDIVQWLLANETHFCVFHSACERFANSSQAMWVHPAMPRSFFPSILPQFDQPRQVNVGTHNLCIIGHVNRREYRFISEYLSSHRKRSRMRGAQFHHYGEGRLRGRLRRFVAIHTLPNFTEFQFDLYQTCDAILSLVTRAGHPEYFEGLTRLTGAIVQAAVYRKPILLHKDLVSVYQQHLEHVETHR